MPIIEYIKDTKELLSERDRIGKALACSPSLVLNQRKLDEKVAQILGAKDWNTAKGIVLKNSQSKELSVEAENHNIDSPSIIKNVQMRPGMYVNSVTKKELFSTVLNNFIGLFKNKYSSSIDIKLDDNEYMSLSDNSNGLYHDFFVNGFDGLFINEFDDLFLNLIAKESAFSKDPMKVNFDNLYNLYVINALSERFDVAYKEFDTFYSCSFEDGKKVDDVYFDKNTPNGFHVRFKINKSHQDENQLDDTHTFISEIKSMLKEYSHLNKGLNIFLSNEDVPTIKYYEPNYDKVFNNHFNELNQGLKKHLISREKRNGLALEVVFVDTKDQSDVEYITYLNDSYISNGGSQEAGIKAYLAAKNKKYNINPELKGVKVLLLMTSNNCKLSNSKLRIVSHSTTKDVYDLLMSE